VPRYLYQGRFTPEGAGGLTQEGGTSRRATIEALISAHGGTLEGFYYAFGRTDVFVIADLPDQATAAAIALTISGSGAVGIETTVLLAPEDIDAASQIDVDYRPPGA
jgi:uncharacterized protein with GYD domain